MTLIEKLKMTCFYESNYILQKRSMHPNKSETHYRGGGFLHFERKKEMLGQVKLGIFQVKLETCQVKLGNMLVYSMNISG